MKKQTQQTIEDIRKKIRSLAITTKKRMNHLLVGDSKTKILGQGLSFDQTREYQHGDDVRLIDWNAYARTQALVSKQYTEERKKNIFILCDVSRSSIIDTGIMSKAEVAKTALSVLMFASAHHTDNVGAFLYADDVILTTPPTNSISGVSAALQTIFESTTKIPGTNLKKVSKELIRRQKKNPATVFIISDFIDDTLSDTIPLLTSIYDVYAIRTIDSVELKIPAVGLLHVTDIETGTQYTLNTQQQKLITELLHNRLQEQNRLFQRFGVPVLDLFSHDPKIIDTMIRFFKKTERRS